SGDYVPIHISGIWPYRIPLPRADVAERKSMGKKCILRHSEILAKIKSTENQVISVLCGILPFLIVTPERLELSTQ
ncbi:hypothetical protein, partial [Paramuribaculum intestinale]|uniref:hypothetical protein n=1 Tax=Paramuribaculum intestinale TaxID=2094151 RepID=UPI0025B678E8